mgnify:CR=1 FL=1
MCSPAIPTVGNVFGRLANTVTRNWTDGNRNYIPDCNLLNLQEQDNRATGGDFCSVVLRLEVRPGHPEYCLRFRTCSRDGASGPTAGSSRPPSNASSRLASDWMVGYFRRWYGNFLVTDNRAVVASDFSSYSVTALKRLPPRPMAAATRSVGLYDLNKLGQVDNFVTFADNYGKFVEHWNGVDVTVNARLQRGVILQGA